MSMAQVIYRFTLIFKAMYNTFLLHASFSYIIYLFTFLDPF